jgi:hypothetical protein
VTNAVKILVSQPGDPAFGVVSPMIPEVVTDDAIEGDGQETLLIAYPRSPLAGATDHVAVVMDDVRLSTGETVQASRGVRVALGLAEAGSQEEAELFAYHAPSRAALAKASLPFERIVRMTEFTTRSKGDATSRLLAMRKAAAEAVRSGGAQVVWEKVKMHPPESPLEFEAMGHLTGIPNYLGPENVLSFSDDGTPVQVRLGDAPFRLTVPKGTGDYRILLFGHGTGGSIEDTNFDGYLGRLNVGKVNYRFDGWTEDQVLVTILGFQRVFKGAAASTAQLLQGLANGAAVQEALASVLGDALAGETVGLEKIPNPAKGRRPKLDIKLWGGGSMGGTMGLVVVAADPTIRHAVLNVPGAAWTQFIPRSAMFKPAFPLIQSAYGNDFVARMVFAMTQTAWDDVDGAVWADAGPKDEGGDPVYLLQESIGDTVIDNVGTEMLARATGAVLVGPVLDPIAGTEAHEVAEGRTALSQYRVPFTGDYDIHGFANCKNPGGDAARAQIQAFFESVWAGKPRIVYPTKSCLDAKVPGICDYDGAWSKEGCDKIGSGL